LAAAAAGYAGGLSGTLRRGWMTGLVVTLLKGHAVCKAIMLVRFLNSEALE